MTFVDFRAFVIQTPVRRVLTSRYGHFQLSLEHGACISRSFVMQRIA